ncbi:MAG: PAS domain S-box protein, partial [Planctomycetes bacterium]|nr:PAS domain S-box protein [Planctomycetota bacterium]
MSEPAHINREASLGQAESLRAAVGEIADQLCRAVDGTCDFTVRTNVTDETAEKLQMLVNFVLDAARRSLAEAGSKSDALAEANRGLATENARRRTVEEELQQSEARSRAIVDTAADGIITIDERGVVESFNGAAEKIFGYSAGEIIGQNVNTLMPSPYRDEHDGYLSTYLNTGVKRIIGGNREVLGRRKDHSIFPMDLHVSEVLLGTSRVFTAIVRDITDRKRVEEELRGMGIALDRAMAGISRLDTDGRYAMVSNAYATLSGYEPDEMIGMSWEPTVHPEGREDARAAYREMLAEGKSEFETRGLRKDGSMFDKHVALIRMCDHDGKFAGHYCLMRDVTERNEAQEKITFLAKIPDQNPDPVLRVKEDGTLLYA